MQSLRHLEVAPASAQQARTSPPLLPALAQDGGCCTNWVASDGFKTMLACLRTSLLARQPTSPHGLNTAMLGAHLAHISTGKGGKAGVGAGIQKGLFCRCFLPFHALRYPLIPTLNRLDKAEVTGSSPVSPIPKCPRKCGVFRSEGGPAGSQNRANRAFLTFLPHGSAETESTALASDAGTGWDEQAPEQLAERLALSRLKRDRRSGRSRAGLGWREGR
jgi:hypothetical protein